MFQHYAHVFNRVWQFGHVYIFLTVCDCMACICVPRLDAVALIYTYVCTSWQLCVTRLASRQRMGRGSKHACAGDRVWSFGRHVRQKCAAGGPELFVRTQYSRATARRSESNARCTVCARLWREESGEMRKSKWCGRFRKKNAQKKPESDRSGRRSHGLTNKTCMYHSPSKPNLTKMELLLLSNQCRDWTICAQRNWPTHVELQNSWTLSIQNRHKMHLYPTYNSRKISARKQMCDPCSA